MTSARCNNNVNKIITYWKTNAISSWYANSVLKMNETETQSFCQCIFTKVSQSNQVSYFQYFFSSESQRAELIQKVNATSPLNACNKSAAAGGYETTFELFGKYVN